MSHNVPRLQLMAIADHTIIDDELSKHPIFMALIVVQTACVLSTYVEEKLNRHKALLQYKANFDDTSL